MKRIAVLSTMCLVLLAGAGKAAAEPYAIRPVSTLTLDFEGDVLRFEGSDFVVNQDAMASVGIFFTRTSDPSCDPCRVGDTFDPGFRTSGEVLLGYGSATFGSTNYSDLTLYGTLAVDATPVAFPGGPGDGFLLETPFTFNGALRGVRGGEQAFAGDFIGSGRAVRFFDRFEDGSYGAGENHQVFLFETPDAAPVPEPGTIALVGGGALVAAVIRRRRQHPTV